MKIKIPNHETKMCAQLVKRFEEILQKGFLARKVSVAVEDGGNQGLDISCYWLHVDEA